MIWRGAFIQKEVPRDSGSFQLVAPVSIEATIGTVVSETAGDPSSTSKDETTELVIDFYGARTLSSAADSDVIANREINAIAIGSMETGWSICQFTDVSSGTPADPYGSRFTISGLYWGRFATDVPTAGTLAGMDAVLIDSALKPLQMPIDDFRVPRKYIAPTGGQPADDAEEIEFTLQGYSHKHPAPSLIAGYRNAVGAILVDWKAAVQGVGGIREGLRNPLGDEQERYAFYVTSDDGATVHYRFEVTPGLTFNYAFWQVAYLPWPDVMDTLDGNGGMLFAQVTVNYGTYSVDYKGAALRSAQVFSGEVKIVFTVGGLATPTVGLQLLGKDAWLDPVPFSMLCDPVNSEVYAEGALVAGVTCDEGDEFTIWKMKDGQVRYYKGADITDSTIPIHISTATPDALPYVAVAQDAVQGELASVRIVRQEPEAVITADMQTEKFAGLKDPIRVRVNRISTLVGEGRDADAFV